MKRDFLGYSRSAAEITLFYPGQASLEWVLKGSDHGGKRAFVTGDRCYDCHLDEEVNIGAKIADFFAPASEAGSDEDGYQIDLELPGVGPHDLLVKVRAAGICHSDAHYRDGTVTLNALSPCRT